MIKKIPYIVTTSLLLLGCKSEMHNNSVTADVTDKLTAQQQLDGFANNLQVKYNFLSNIETDCPELKGKKVKHCYSAEIHFSLPKAALLI